MAALGLAIEAGITATHVPDVITVATGANDDCRAATVVPETELLDAEQRYVDGHIPSTHQSFEQYVVRRWGQQEPEARGSVHVFQSLEQLTIEAHWMRAWGGEISFG